MERRAMTILFRGEVFQHPFFLFLFSFILFYSVNFIRGKYASLGKHGDGVRYDLRRSLPKHECGFDMMFLHETVF